MKKLFLLFSMMALAFNASADNVLVVDDVHVRPGGRATIAVKYDFESELICGYQFDFQLPEGISRAGAAKNGETIDPTWTIGSNIVDEATKHFRLATFSYGEDEQGHASGNIPVTDHQGVMVYIPISADKSLTDGTVLQGRLFDAVLPENTGADFKPEPITFNIIIDSDAGYTDLFETSEVAPDDAEDVDVRVYRTIKANEWSTICLPFDMTEEQVKESFGNDVKLADFTGWSVEKNDDGDIMFINVSFSSISAIEANHPCIIKTSSDISQFVVERVNITVDDAEVSVRSGSTGRMRGYMFGNYEANTIVEDGDLFLAGNKFWYSIGNTKIKAFRGYFELPEYLASYESDYSAKVSFTIDDTPTSIVNVNTQESNDEIYSVSGMNVGKDASRLQRGVYIMNGKKVVKK